MSSPLTSAAAAASSGSSRSVSDILHKGSHCFIVKGFSFTKGMGTERSLISDAFLAGGHKWVVALYSDSKAPEGGAAYVSVFVRLASEATDVRAFFSIGLCDMSGNRNNMAICPWSPSNTPPFNFKHKGSQWGYQRFCTRNAFEISDYLKDDSLRIDCNVGVVDKCARSMPLPSINVPSSDDHDARFGILLDKNEPSNVVFNVAGELFKAHHEVFLARCPMFEFEYMRRMMLSNEEIVVIGMDPKVFKAFLHYLYRDRIVADEDLLASSSSSSTSLQHWVVAKLLAVSNRYKLSRLLLMCESFLLKHLKMDSFVEMHEMHSLSIRCNARALRRVCDQLHSYVCKVGTVRNPDLRSLTLGGEEIHPGGADSVWVNVPEGTNTYSRCSMRLVLGPLSVDYTSHLLLVPGKRQGDGGLPTKRKQVQVCTCLALKSCYWEGKCQTATRPF